MFTRRMSAQDRRSGSLIFVHLHSFALAPVRAVFPVPNFVSWAVPIVGFGIALGANTSSGIIVATIFFTRRSRMFYRHTIVAGFAALIVALTLTKGISNAQTGGAIEAIRPVVEQAAAVMRNRDLPLTDRRKQLHDLVLKYFDFAYMARSSLGSHWKELSDDQHQQFTQAFAAFVEASYLSRIKTFAEFEYHFIREVSEA